MLRIDNGLASKILNQKDNMNLPPLAGGFVSYFEESSETGQNAHVKPFIDLKRAIAAQLRENQTGTLGFYLVGW